MFINDQIIYLQLQKRAAPTSRSSLWNIWEALVRTSMVGWTVHLRAEP